MAVDFQDTEADKVQGCRSWILQDTEPVINRIPIAETK